MKHILFALLFSQFNAHAVIPYTSPDPDIVPEPQNLSTHVKWIKGFPNIGFVIGKTGTLIVETGMGKPNARKILEVAKILAPTNKIYFTSTHFHPEHASGAFGFPKDAVFIRNERQEQEAKQNEAAMIEVFRGRSADFKAALKGFIPRAADETFAKEKELDLGDVHAKLMWLGEAHTKGDELIYVPEDKTLISGDVVQNKQAPHIYGEGGTVESWIAILDKLLAMPIEHVLPDHSAPGDGSLVKEEKDFLVRMQKDVAELRKTLPLEKIQDQLDKQYAKDFPGWDLKNVKHFVETIYNAKT